VKPHLATLLVAAALGPCATDAWSDEIPSSPEAVSRPAIKANRWQEDWEALRDPSLRTEPLDGLKYIALSDVDPKRYVSFGATLRERFETNDAPALGTGSTNRDSYLLQRLQIHADLHLDESWRIFAQLEDDRAFDKRTRASADQDRVDLRLAFAEYVGRFSNGTLKARVGRQDFAFDLQRFVSSRDGPNVRQSFDAAWADWETADWRFIAFVSEPVQYKDGHDFDDSSNGTFRFHTLRVERHVLGNNELSAYWSLYERGSARYGDATGFERRNAYDVRFAGSAQDLDWDAEAMAQTGRVGQSAIRAWAIGARAGYTFYGVSWRPRAGLQFDAASGDKRHDDGTLGTFNPLFPNGYYFALASYTGYTNLLHLKPTLTLRPANGVSVLGAVGLLWREATADAVYLQPNIPIAGTAGGGSRWTGSYVQLRIDYAVDRHLGTALEAVNYKVGDTVRNAGGHDSTYLGLELKYSW
jgi:hypothetical protein